MEARTVAPFFFRNNPQRDRIQESRVRRALRASRRFGLEIMEPRLLLSADDVLGAGATAEIVDALEDYGSLIQAHIDDTSTDFDARIPGILLSQRDVDGMDGITDDDIGAPHYRDLLAVEVEQFVDIDTANPGSPSDASSPDTIYHALIDYGGFNAEHLLGVLDTDNSSTVSWYEAYRGIIVGAIQHLLQTYNGTDVVDDDVIDALDVEQWVLNGDGGTVLGLNDLFAFSLFPRSDLLTTWFNIDLNNLSVGGSGTFDLSFTADIDFVDSYLIDLGIEADILEIQFPEWEFHFIDPLHVDALDRDVSITGNVLAPVAVSWSGNATFAATGHLLSSVQAGGDGDVSLLNKVVNVGFLGTEADTGSVLELSMAIDTEIVDPSSPTRLGFEDEDGDNNLAELLAFEAASDGGDADTGGTLAATESPDAAFNLATPIRFDLTLEYETGDSGPIPVSVNVSSAGTASAVRTALESAINGTVLSELLTVTESGGLLSINIVGGNATGLGFSDGTHSDETSPYTLTAGTGFDFDSDNDDGVEDAGEEVSFAEVRFLLSVGGDLPEFVTVAAGSYNSSGWQAAVQAALDAVFGAGVVTATVNVANLNDVRLTLSSGSTLEIADTDTLVLTMAAVNAITQGELDDLDDAIPDQQHRIFTSTPNEATDNFRIILNLEVRDGIDFTPSGAPSLEINADSVGGPFGLDNDASESDPDLTFRTDFNGNERFALEVMRTDLEQFLDFNVFGPAETIAMLQQLEGWLERLEQHVALSGYDIPLVQSVLGQVLDLSDLFHDTFLSDDMDNDEDDDDDGKLLQVIDDLNPDGDSIIFFTAQELGAALDFLGILELTGSGDYADYEPDNGIPDDLSDLNVLYHVTAEHMIADLELPVDFTLDLSPLGNIFSDSSLFIEATGTFEAILGIRMGEAGGIAEDTPLADLNNEIGVEIVEGPAITAAAAVERVEGRLLGNAEFTVTVNGTPYVIEVSAADTSGFTETSELLQLIQDELDAAIGMPDKVIATQDGARIRLVAGAGVTTLSLSVSTSDPAFTELGLQSGPASTVSWMSDPIVRVTVGGTATLRIGIFGESDVDLNLDNIAGNATLTDLVNDINARIDDTSLDGQVVASRFGNRLVLSAIDESIYGFRVTTLDNGGGLFHDDFSQLDVNAWLTVTAPNEPDSETLAKYGRLSNPFDLTINDGINGDVVISIAVSETEGFGSLAEFVDLLNDKIEASALDDAGVATVLAFVAGTRIALRANDPDADELVVSSPSAGAVEMGFEGMLTAGILGVTANRAAPYYYGPTDTAAFDITLTGYDLDGTVGSTQTVTLEYEADPIELLTNDSIYDLAADVQRALNAAFGSASNNPILVTVDSGRLLFTVKPGTMGTNNGHGVTGFTITIDPTDGDAQELAISELKLYDLNDSDPLTGMVTLVANDADLLIQDRTGTYHFVALKDMSGDPLTTVGEVLDAIDDQTSGAVDAEIDPQLQQGLLLTDTTGGSSNPLNVRTVNGSNAAIDLGIYLGGVSAQEQTAPDDTIEVSPDVVRGDTIGTLALIDRVFLRQVDGSTPILSVDFDVFTDDPIVVEANFGFVAITATGEGTLDADVEVSIVNGAGGRTTVRDLFSAVAEDRNDDGNIDMLDFDDVVNQPFFDLDGEFEFDVTVDAGGGIEALITDIDGGTAGIQVGTFSIEVSNPGNPFVDTNPDPDIFTPIPPDVDVTWTAGDLGDLEQFENIDFEDVLNALKALVGFLDDYAGQSFLNNEIPLIGISFNELVDLADRFRTAVEEIEANPAGSVQLLEQKIREEFGLGPGVLTLALADGDDGDTDLDDLLKIRFDLGGAFSESLAIAFGIPNGLIDDAPVDISLEGQADLHVTGDLMAYFTIGVDLNTPLQDDAPVFLFTHEDDTKIAGSLSASAEGLTFNAALGPAGVIIADGFAELSITASFASDDMMGTKVALSGAFTSFDQVTFDGSAEAVMPVYFPTQSTYIGDITLNAAFDTTGITMFDVDAPDFGTLDFESFSIFDNIGLLIDATDIFLSTVQDALEGQVLGFEVPLAGTQLNEAARFIEEFRSGFIKDLRNLVENAPELAATTIQGFLFDLLNGLGLLADTDGSGGVNVNDVIIEGLDSLDTPSTSDDYLQWNVLLGDTIPIADINLPFDLGFPALGLEGDIKLDVSVGWELGFGLGISLADGAYIDVRRQDYSDDDMDPSENDVLPELIVTFDVNVHPGAELSGSLLFLQLDIEEAPQDLDGEPGNESTHFHAQFSVDLMKGEDADAERLAFSDLGNLDFDLDMGADAAVNLDLTLKFNEDLIGESPLSAVLPQVNAHFALLWEFSLDDAETGEFDLSQGLKYIAFENVELDLGKFLADTIGPLIEKIQTVTEPFQPIVDIMVAAIPVLSDLAGQPVTLADIAAAFGEFNPELIYAIADLISLVNSIGTEPGSLTLEFGSFVLVDNRDPMNEMLFGGLGDISDLADPNFNFGGADESTFAGFFSGIPSLNDALNNANDPDDDADTKATAMSLFGGDFNRGEYGFAFPIFEDPAQIFGLFVGRPAVIVTYDLPPFVLDFSWKQSFPIYGPLWGVVTASVGMKIDLAFGYDTQGVTDFFNSGFTNPLTLLGGLFIADTDIPAGGGVDVPELVLTGSIGVGAELNAGIASAGVTVNIIITANFDFYDPNHDDRIRIDELLSTFLYELRNGDAALAPISIFDINIEIALQLKAFLEILALEFEFDITPPITLLEFMIPFEREPFLATERADGSLLLNIGTNAAARMNGDLRDLSEEICVHYNGDGTVSVWAPALGVDEGGAQIYEVNPNVGIFAYGGEGNDVIVVQGDIKVYAEGGSGDDIIVVDGSTKTAELHGGLGNDTLVGSGGDDRIWGDAGDDLIHGRDGVDWLFGDTAMISNGPTGSMRVTASDEDGNDIVWGGGDDDVIFGGGGNDILAGDSDMIPNLSFNPFTVCDVMIDLDAIADGGVAGEDFIFGDGGRIDADPGSGDDELILALNGAQDPNDQFRTKFAGIRLTDFGGGGSDNIYGQAENDVIFGGAGDDQADGGTENDIIYGESGFDTLSGGAHDDEIQGGVGGDTIFGFGPGPGDPRNDGGSMGADGDDTLYGDDGNDVIRGNGSSDDMDFSDGVTGDHIFGGRGADVIFGDAGTDEIFGENEGDLIFGGAGDDYVEGGTGNDTVFGDDGLVIYFKGNIDDFTDDRVIGDAFAFGAPNSIFDYYDTAMPPMTPDDIGDDNNDLTLDLMITYVRATDGDDYVIGGEGDDIAFGGAGDDTLFGDLDPAKWLEDYAGVMPPPVPAGTDTLIGDSGLIEWFGRRIDRIEAFKGVDATQAGDDTIMGNGGPDRLLGGGGSDIMYGRMPESFDTPQADADKLNEDVGVDPGKEVSDNDIMIGDDGVIDIARNMTKVDHITTTSYAPLVGETYVDTMFGNWGWDVMLGGLGGDTMRGDTGLVNSDPRGVDDVMLGDNGLLDFTFESDTDLDTLDLIRSERDGLGGVDTMGGDQGSDVLIGGTDGDFMYGDNPGALSGDEDGEDIMLGDNGDIFLIGTDGRLKVLVAHMLVGTAVDLITTSDAVDLAHPTMASAEAVGGGDTMSGNAAADIMLGGVNDGETDTMYGDREMPNPTTIADDFDDIMLGDNGLLDFTFESDTDRNTLDLIRSKEDALGGHDDMSGNKGLDVAIGGTGDDTIYGDDDSASAGSDDLADMLLGDNADIFLVDPEGASGGDIKIVLDVAVKTIQTTDEDFDAMVPANNTGGVDTISGNADGDIIAGGVEGDTLYGDAISSNLVPNLDSDDVILGDNGAFEWLSTGRLGEISGIDIEENNPELFAKYDPGDADTDLTTLDLITTEQPNNGGRDTIYGDEANDLVFGGTDLDLIWGDDGNEEAETSALNRDVLFGDHGRLYPQFSTLMDFNSRNFFAIDTGDADGGEGDIMHGEEGDDVMLGQQGDDRMWGGSGNDDMIGGHNVSGGYDELGTPAVEATLNPPMNDLMDGDSGNDAMAGDNAIMWRRGDDLSPRFRMLTDTAIYTTTVDGVDPAITANIGSDSESDPENAVGRDIELVDHADNTPAGLFGADVMAGGADNDVMFGQLANDLMQGDGSIDDADDLLAQFITRELDVTDSGMDPDTDDTLYFNIPEQGTDGNDYMEGSGGSDLMYGGLGQDDMIGGSSNLFGLITEEMRPDSSDIIFGGAGAPVRIVRNDFVGATDTDLGTAEGVGAVPTDDDPSIALEDRHSRDADFIMGDNANVFRLVDDADNFLEFNYDQSDVEDRGDERIIPRAMQQLDYTLGGSDFHDAGTYDVNGAAIIMGQPNDNGAGDLIHGESGDDYIFGMTGSDVIFGESDDDDIVGGYGHDWISGGTGQDGILGDDGLILTSRNSTLGEPLYGIAPLLEDDPATKYSNGNALDEIISTPGDIQIAEIHVTGRLKKSVDIVPFSFDPDWLGMDDEFPDNDNEMPFADDIIFGGLNSDWLHGGSGDDAISGAEALEHAYVPVFGMGGPIGILDLGYDAFTLPAPINPGDTVANPNPGDVLAFNPEDLDGQHLNNRFRAGEFFLYDEYDPRLVILLDGTGELWKSSAQGAAYEFLLNFDENEGVFRDSGTVPKAVGQQTESYPVVQDDGTDAIFGDLANDWLVGGTGRDNIYGGWGNDLLNADDDHDGHDDDNSENDMPDTHPTYEDRAYGGAGRDVLIGNTGGDRLIDWVGEYNSFLVPYAPFGQASVSRTVQPFLPEFLYALSAGDGADPTRYADAIGGVPPAPTNNNPNPSRNGEPFGEMGLVLQQDFAWGDQTGAPSDPQAGNIPGGPRDVLRSAGFNDGSSDAFFVDSGTWAVAQGAYEVAPVTLGQDAVSVFFVDQYVPSYYEVLAILNAVKPTGGYKSNAYILFDYQSETDFKFAGINVSTNKLEIGHRDETGWIVDIQGAATSSLKSNTNYNVFLSVNGTAVTMIVNNNWSLSFTFTPRVDVYGITHGLNEGMVGLGANNSKARIDNVIVQRLKPATTFSQTVDFTDTTTSLFDSPVSGAWSLAGGRFAGTAGSDPAIDTVSFNVRAASLINLAGTFSVTGEGGFVYDQYAVDDFKFVTLSAGKITLGHRTPKGWFADTVINNGSIVAGADYTLEITLKGSTVSVILDGALVASHTYNALVTDGNFGLLSRTGTTSFDTVTVKSDDPSLLNASFALMAEATTLDSTPVVALTESELESVAGAAKEQWSATLTPDQQSALKDLQFMLVTDLPGNALAWNIGDGITLVDMNAAGRGWFADSTARDSREFSSSGNTLAASSGSTAFGRMDLLSTLIHEIGHTLGHEHTDGGVMNPTLATGERQQLIDWNSSSTDLRALLGWNSTGRSQQPAFPEFTVGASKGKKKLLRDDGNEGEIAAAIETDWYVEV